MSADRPALVIHGHFYQPPRDNPWSGIVDREPSAAPYHDWNERVYDECYRRNAFARVFDDDGTIQRIVNNYEGLSFNFGPTLLSWMERHHPRAYARILEADRRSVSRRDGHGNAIAQGFNHAILPLCTERDLRTQIRWGIAEFRFRYGRQPEALWMPETACNDRVLGALIDEGLRFALLAPGQAARFRKIGDHGWQDVADGTIDPQRAYRYAHRDGSGRSMALFFYDGPISRAVAFENVLASSYDLVSRFEAAAGGAGTLVHVVTDGESYGHHFSGGERCLAYTLEEEAARRGFFVTNYGQWLERHAPEYEVEIKEGEDGLGTSWSCAHGVGRWHRDCGCHTGGKPGWNQRWRKPLRDALDLLRDEAASAYEDLMGSLAGHPWQLRDAYIELLLDGGADRRAFFDRQVGRALSSGETTRALRLLEMQRSSMLMYTSCGWFFSDLSGIETVQVMRYAGRLLDQLDELGVMAPRESFLEALAEAESNVGAKGNGADIFRREVEPARVTTAAIAAHIGMSCLPGEVPDGGEVASHRYELKDLVLRQHGRFKLATGRVALQAIATGADCEYGMAALHFGGIDVYCMLRAFAEELGFARAAKRLWLNLETGSLLTILRVAQEEFGADEYGLEHILPGGRDAISRSVLADSLSRYRAQYERLYEDNRRLIAQFHSADLPLPEELRVAAEITLSRWLEAELGRPRDRWDADSYRRAVDIADEAQRFGFELRCTEGKERFERMIESLVRRVVEGDREAVDAEVISSALELLELTETLGIQISLERAQELLYPLIGLGRPLAEPIRRLAVALGLSEQSGTLDRPSGPALEGPGSRRGAGAPR